MFPLAAMIAREEFNVSADQALGHYTHEKSPAACAAGLATLDVIESEDLLSKTITLGSYVKERLTSLQQKYTIIYEVRGIGLVIGLVLRNADGSRANEAAEKILYDALGKGLSFKITMGSILTLTPPLTISQSEIDDALAILESCFKSL